MAELNLKGNEMNTALVMRTNAQEFALALKNTLEKLSTYKVLDVTYSTYYDATRKRPCYSALIVFKEVNLEDLNEDGIPDSQQQPKPAEHHHHYHDAPAPAVPPKHHHHFPAPPPPIQWLDIEPEDHHHHHHHHQQNCNCNTDTDTDNGNG